MFLEYSQENNCTEVSFLIKLLEEDLKLYQKIIPAQVFFSVFCKIFKNTYFEEYSCKYSKVLESVQTTLDPTENIGAKQIEIRNDFSQMFSGVYLESSLTSTRDLFCENT